MCSSAVRAGGRLRSTSRPWRSPAGAAACQLRRREACRYPRAGVQLATTHLHVPPPGELVSPESGSALVTIARALGETHIAAGGDAAFVVRQGLKHQTDHMRLVYADLPDKVWL